MGQESMLPNESVSKEASSLARQIHSTAELSLDTITHEIRNALQAEQYDTVISRTSALMDSKNKTTAELVELRATAYQKTANNTKELEDAYLLIQLDTQNANPYLRAAKVLTIQGKQEKAIEVLEDGIKACPDETQHVLLLQQIDQTKHRLERRVDFIVQSPYDILCNILTHFCHADDILPCLIVSLSWLIKIAYCPVPWRSVEFSTWSKSTAVFTGLSDFLSVISRHIHRLKVALSKELVLKYLDVITVCNFCNLRALDIDEQSYEDDIDLTNPLYAALPHVSQTLTELKLCSMSISVGRILTMCPNLTTLHVFGKSITGVSDDFPVLHTTKLISVRLYSNRHIMTVAELAPIIERSPHIQDLHLYNSSIQYFSEDILAVVAKHCPELKTLKTAEIDSCEFEFDPNADIILANSKSSGLHMLMLSNVTSIVPLRNHLERSTGSLEYIYLERVNEGTAADWAPLSTVTFPKLTRLHINLSECSPGFCKQIPSMLRRYPALNDLCLEDIERSTTATDTDPILDAVTELKHLTILKLETIDLHSESFTRLLEHCATQQEGRQSLRELAIPYCDGVDIDTLHEISRITTLQSLHIHLPEDAEASDTTELMRQLSQLPELVSLKLAKSELTMEAAQYLIKSRKLTELEALHVKMSSEVQELFHSPDSRILLENFKWL